MNEEYTLKRTIGLFGATGIGVGAIVGGGILALAGVAFAATGPAAILAFALNGVIALLAALSFAEISSTFPESGGPYLFSKKILSIRSAFLVGWIVWFASIVAAVLYAVGFASFGIIVINSLWYTQIGIPPEWLSSTMALSVLAVISIIFYTLSLVRHPGSGGQFVNISKLLVFTILIAGGLWVFASEFSEEMYIRLTPFFTRGVTGLLEAMGFTFIALQGFGLISNVGGEIKDPEKTIPRSMIFSLMIALLIYIPLLFVIATVGVGAGETVSELGEKYPEILIAVAARNYLGEFGYWLVIAAAILSMLSALNANLLASSRVAFAMGRDRTLAESLGDINRRFGTPVKAILLTSSIVVMVTFLLPNVAAAGAAASLIFLITYAIVQGIGILLRKRTSDEKIPFKVPLFPLIPVAGIIFSVALAVFQGIAVPSAGLIILFWLIAGSILYILLFARRARVYDALSEGLDPQLVRLRGKSPVVLVPISNPTNAASMVALASSLVPSSLGRVLLLSVVTKPEGWKKGDYPPQLVNSQKVLKEVLSASFAEGLHSEALTTVADDVWDEIKRVSRDYHCSSLVLGLSNLYEEVEGTNLENLIDTVDCDVVVIRVPSGWKFSEVKKVLVPVGGEGRHGILLARLLGSLCRNTNPEITFLKVLPEDAGGDEITRARQKLFYLAHDQVLGNRFKVKVARNDDIVDELSKQSLDMDLVVLGLRRVGKHRAFGDLALSLARNSNCPLVLISHYE